MVSLVKSITVADTDGHPLIIGQEYRIIPLARRYAWRTGVVFVGGLHGRTVWVKYARATRHVLVDPSTVDFERL